METVSVSELRAKLPGYLRRAKAGEEVVVTDRGRPVAVLGPPPKAVVDRARLQRLADQGLVKLGKGIPDEFFDRPIREDPTGSVLKALLEEREEGW